MTVDPSSGTQYEIAKYRPEFKGEVAQLQRHLWSPDLTLNTAYFEWKHERNPYVAEPMVHLVFCDGEAVGMIGFFGSKWQIGSPPRVFCVPCSSDFVIHPEHRDRGLFSDLTMGALDDLMDRGYTHAFGLSATLTTYVGYLMRGWRSAGDLETAHSPVRRRPRYERLRGLGQRIPGLLTAYRRAQQSIRRSSAPTPARRQDPFTILDRNAAERYDGSSGRVYVAEVPRPGMMTELAERVSDPGRIRHVRDEQYFGWRFENPRSVYRFLFWEDGRLEGYIVLQRASSMTDDIGATVVDWEASDPQILNGLIQRAIDWGEFSELKIWTEPLPEETRGHLRNLGFWFSGKKTGAMRKGAGPTILVRPTIKKIRPDQWTLGNSDPLDLANWDMRPIFADNF